MPYMARRTSQTLEQSIMWLQGGSLEIRAGRRTYVRYGITNTPILCDFSLCATKRSPNVQSEAAAIKLPTPHYHDVNAQPLVSLNIKKLRQSNPYGPDRRKKELAKHIQNSEQGTNSCSTNIQLYYYFPNISVFIASDIL